MGVVLPEELEHSDWLDVVIIVAAFFILAVAVVFMAPVHLVRVLSGREPSWL